MDKRMNDSTSKPLLFFILLFLLGFTVSCSDDLLTREKMWKMAEEASEGGITVVVPSEDVQPVSCHDYGKGCIFGIHLNAWGMRMIVVMFDNFKGAKLAALTYDAYYYKNWIFDDIENEPYLQDFVKRVYGAVRARDEIKDISFPSPIPYLENPFRKMLLEKGNHKVRIGGRGGGGEPKESAEKSSEGGHSSH